MDEALKNQVINSVEETYLKELKNKYTGFFGVTRCNLFGHLLDQYGKITTVNLESNNQRMNEPIDSSLPIDEYFERIYDCVQYSDDGKTPYTAVQLIQKAYHAVLENLEFTLVPARNREKFLRTNKRGLGLRRFPQRNITI